VICPD